MRWADERYVRVYTRDNGDWILLGWEAQALLLLALRKSDRAGIIKTGSNHVRGLAAMTGMPLDLVSRALPLLLEGDGPPMVVSGDSIVVRNFIEAQESAQSDAQRARESRARIRDAKLACVVTKRDDSVAECDETVTGSHESSQPVTPCLAVPSRAEPTYTHCVDELPSQSSLWPSDIEPSKVERRDNEIRAVFAHYKTHRPRTFPKVHSGLPEWRLLHDRMAKDGRTVEDLRRCIDGYFSDPWHQGKNDRSKKYLDLGLMVRDEQHVSRGIELAEKPATQPRQTKVVAE